MTPPEKRGQDPFSTLPKKGPDPFFIAVALGLALLLVVVVAAAAIRLEWAFAWVRAIHRIAASFEVVAVLWLGWMAWRSRAVLIALGLTAFLSAIGIAAGQDPPPAAATANLLGGLALTATFAWILGRESGSGKKGSGPFLPSRSSGKRVLTPFSTPICAVLIAVQVVLGARLAIVDRFAPALPAHGLLAVGLAALLAWVGLARVRGTAGKLLFAAAVAAPLAGFTSLHYEYSAAAALVHAAAAALLLASAAYALGRVA